MARVLKILTFLIVTFLLIPATIEAGNYKICDDIRGYPPFLIVSDSKIHGIGPVFLRAIFNELGLDFDTHKDVTLMTWKDCVDRVKSGDFP